MRRISRRVWIIAAAVVAITGGAWAVGRNGADGEAPVLRRDVVKKVVAPGVVESVSGEVSLGFDAAGRVAELFVDEGSRVEPGQLLGRLDDRIARAMVTRAEAALAAAEADRLLAFRGARADEIRAAEAELGAARAQAQDRAVSRERAERLSTVNAVANADVDGARHAAEAARAAAAAAEARLALIRQGSRSEERQRAVAAVAAAQADVEQARTLLSHTELRAPFAGTIVRRLVEAGEQVTTVPPTVAITLADLQHLRLRTEIDETDVGRIRLGQAGYACADAFGDRRFPGRIARVGQTLGRKNIVSDDPRARFDTRVLEVLFELSDPSGLPLGLRLDVHVETEARRNVLTVPLAAVERGRRNAQVTVKSPSGDSPRNIRLGIDDGVVAEVLSGVSEGERVSVR
ncbi:MAG: efflux RND transporter periplasmic adaptor subunit [Deltaproteobacteria bacterium]|nr:efflux RND transporter periplasmic adaptor subunit [Deltaproteobacteria bacterium]